VPRKRIVVGTLPPSSRLSTLTTCGRRSGSGSSSSGRTPVSPLMPPVSGTIESTLLNSSRAEHFNQQAAAAAASSMHRKYLFINSATPALTPAVRYSRCVHARCCCSAPTPASAPPGSAPITPQQP
jgi:hypothetical protein